MVCVSSGVCFSCAVCPLPVFHTTGFPAGVMPSASMAYSNALILWMRIILFNDTIIRDSKTDKLDFSACRAILTLLFYNFANGQNVLSFTY